MGVFIVNFKMCGPDFLVHFLEGTWGSHGAVLCSKPLLVKWFGANGFIQKRKKPKFRINSVYGIVCFILQM